MKTKFYTISLLLALSLPAQAALMIYNGPFNNNGDAGAGVIPDNSTIGLSDAEVVSGLPSISSVLLRVTLQGGAENDLTGYLRLGNQSGSPFYDLTTTLANLNVTGSTPIIFNVDVSSTFSSLNPNDTWTLFFADTSPGGQNTLNSWSLNIEAVPEPVNVSLEIFGGVIGVFALARMLKKTKLGVGEKLNS